MHEKSPFILRGHRNRNSLLSLVTNWIAYVTIVIGWCRFHAYIFLEESTISFVLKVTAFNVQRDDTRSAVDYRKVDYRKTRRKLATSIDTHKE